MASSPTSVYSTHPAQDTENENEKTFQETVLASLTYASSTSSSSSSSTSTSSLPSAAAAPLPLPLISTPSSSSSSSNNSNTSSATLIPTPISATPPVSSSPSRNPLSTQPNATSTTTSPSPPSSLPQTMTPEPEAPKSREAKESAAFIEMYRLAQKDQRIMSVGDPEWKALMAPFRAAQRAAALAEKENTPAATETEKQGFRAKARKILGLGGKRGGRSVSVGLGVAA